MTWIVVALTLPWTMFIVFCGLMALKRAQRAGQLTKWMKVLGYPWLVVGAPLDVGLNVLWGSVIFKELPREWTFSARLWRWSNQTEDDARRRRALRYRVNLLDAIDPDGVHRG